MAVPFQRDRFTWLAYLMLAYFAYLQAVLGPLMPFLRAELGLSYTVAGLIPSAFATGMILSGLGSDRLARRWSRGAIFWLGAFGMAAGGLSLALSRVTAITLASALVMGILGTLLLAMIQATLSDRHREQRVIALTESNVVASIAAALAPLAVAGLQRAGPGWRWSLILAIGAAALAFAAFRSVAMPGSRRPDGQVRDSSPDSPALSLSFWSYWLVICLVVAAEWSVVFWGADFLESVVGLPRVDAVSLMSVFLGAMVLGRITGSRLTRSLSGQTLLFSALGLSLLGIPLFWLAPSPALNILGLFIAGLGIGNLYPLAMSVALGAAGDLSDAASARVTFGAGLAIFISPFTLGRLADLIGLRAAFGVVLILLLAALPLIWLAYRPRPIKTPHHA